MVNISNIKKFLVAVAGLAGVAIANGYVPAAEVKWVSAGIAALSAIGVYLVPNGPTSKEVIGAAVKEAVASGRENVN
jgi:hypothetical protein